ncbi:hypothetical protein ACWD8C_19805, partial [Streptomyces sp. NPDC005166]
MPGDKKAFPADRSIVIIAMALGALAGLNLDRDEAFESDARAASVGDCLQSSGLKAGSLLHSSRDRVTSPQASQSLATRARRAGA